MPPKTRITKELVLQKAFEITRNEGIEFLNARYLAKKLGCSTMPIFKIFNDMPNLKRELHKMVDSYYDQFISHYIDKSHYLATISFAYINFSLQERNLFGALFVNEFIETRSIQEIIHSSWNRETIEHTSLEYGISILQSETLYRDIRFYSHGIATQLYGGNVTLTEEEIWHLLENAITKFLL